MRRTMMSGVRALAATMVWAAAALPACGDDGSSGGGDTDAFTPDIVPSECQYDRQCEGQIPTGTCEIARCVSGTCQAVAAPVWSPCDLAGAGECERGGCNPDGACVLVTAENGTPCDVGAWNACVGYQCQAGLCREIDLAGCDDGNPCTDDGCVPGVGCVFTPNTAPCNDGNPCTGGDVCADGECRGTEVLCQCESDADCVAFDDGDKCNGVLMCDVAARVCVPKPNSAVTCSQDGLGPCQVRECVPATGQCQVSAGPDGVACDDGDPCTGCAPGEACDQGDACQAGVCQGGAAEPCACVEDADCQIFDDGDLCNGAWTCQLGTCAPAEGSEVDCSGQEAPACHALACDPATGTCEAQPLADGAGCDDGDPCTGGDSCQAGVCTAGTEDLCGCEEDADCAAFDDGLICNGVWTCQDGTCAFDAASVVDCSGEAGGVCQIAVCNEDTGACDTVAANDGTPCDDGDACTGGDTCMAGVCTAGDEDACACEDDLGCAAFDDGDLCNGTWVCVIGEGESTGTCVEDPTPVVCTTDAPCVQVACVPETGACESTVLEAGEPCDDGDACTSGETCAAGGVCTPADQVTCPDLGPCVTNTCDSASGQCVEAAALDGTACDDGIACTADDVCQAGVCEGTVVGECACEVDDDCAFLDDGDPCTGSWRCGLGEACELVAATCDTCPSLPECD